MISDNYPCGSTLREVFDYFAVSPAHGAVLANRLIAEGYPEDGICYAAGQRRSLLLCCVGNRRFDSEFIGAVRVCATKWMLRTSK